MSAPPRPRYLSVIPENVPEQLVQLPQWCCWRAAWRVDKQGEGKWTKPPYQPDGRPASSTDPATWAEFGECLLAYQLRGFDGIGFMLAKSAGIIGVDLDHCLDETGALEPKAQPIVDQFNSYTEVSPSGDGLHIFVFGTFPEGMTGRKKGPIEVYAEGRYLTVTGHVFEGGAVCHP